MDTLSRALAYLEKLDPAISGSGGHNATLRAACECFRFGLSRPEADEAMQWFNEHRCEPRWGAIELQHKLDDAEKIVSASGRLGVRGSSRARRMFIPPPIPQPTKPILPVCQQSEQAEELWWARVAIGRGVTLAEWDRVKE